ncbi:D-cysteine desulfhydrase [Primorskyibacter sp. S187A]|uniref:D-cysteine desulfhydrase n=1 Tax=Primorskyibacter sp. S187A TaxID=3415130 RepID=UPI003C7CE1D8
MAEAEMVTRNGARIDFDRFPRTALCHQPTPIEAMPRLSAHLGGPTLFIKRDDCTGLATGGNKTRKLEFLVGEALAQGADMLVTQGAVQSNHVRQTAAAACKMGMACHVLLERRVPDRDASYETTGNVLLDNLFGATHEFRGPGLDMNAEAEAVVEQLRAKGHKVYFIPGGGSNPVGALGYANCAQEIADQCAHTGQSFDWLVMGTGSTGTQAGLVAGFSAIGYDLPVMGVSVRQPKARQVAAVHGLTQRTAEKLGAEAVPESKIFVDDGYVGEGYGIPAESTLEAIRLLARQEGLLLDPVYSAKGMAGLIGMIRQGFFKPSDNILFLHTGGATALFAYEDQLT